MAISNSFILDGVTFTTVALSLLFVSAIYSVNLVIQRLFLSPIARFPGPKLAALTFWYELYYDVYLQGQYIFKIEELHRTYGPIVRINPYELHVIDSDFYDTLYSAGATRRHKWQWCYKQFSTEKSSFGTSNHDLHRMRRSVLNPYFSKRSISGLESMIREKVDRLCSRFRDAATRKQPVILEYAFGALTLDVITRYCYGIDYESVNSPDFDPMWLDAITNLSKNGHFLKHFGFMIPLMTSLPDSLVLKLNPLIANMLKLQKDVRTQVVSLMKTNEKEDLSRDTIFHSLINNNLPQQEKELQRIVEEAVLIVGAGQLTTADVLSVIFYQLIKNPEKLQMLRHELDEAIPDPNNLPHYQQLEHLPYLTAVILEGLRVTDPVCTRLPRIPPDEDLKFQEWVIPKGTPVSMSAYFVHRDQRYFPDAEKFVPERWVEPQARMRLERYLVAFSKGSRICLGMNLAYEEMYFACAAIIQRFDMELYETSEKDVKMTRDMFNPHTDDGTRKIQVIFQPRVWG